MIRTRLLLPCSSALALLAALAMAACTTTTPQSPLDVSAPPDQEVQVTLREGFTIAASTASIRTGRVKFTITNEDSQNHGFTIEGQGLEQYLPPGASLTRETRMTSGTAILYCPIDDHRERGMQTSITVG